MFAIRTSALFECARQTSTGFGHSPSLDDEGNGHGDVLDDARRADDGAGREHVARTTASCGKLYSKTTTPSIAVLHANRWTPCIQQMQFCAAILFADC